MSADPVTLAITGASGRMGGELRAAAAEREDVTVTLVVDARDNLEDVAERGATVGVEERADAGAEERADAGAEERVDAGAEERAAAGAKAEANATDPVTGARVGAAEDLPALLEDGDVDVLVDFTVAEACVPAIEAAADAGVAAVVGTTGLHDEQLGALRDASEATPVLKAANFARGVQVLLDLVGRAAEGMEGYDAELLETHHNGKRDAPSGTAKRILRELEDSRPTGDRVHGREGHAPRSEDEIGVHAVRAGDVTGIHEVLLAGNHEELRLTHRAEDRGVFAAGALDAAAWLAGRDPGWYDFSDVLHGE